MVCGVSICNLDKNNATLFTFQVKYGIISKNGGCIMFDNIGDKLRLLAIIFFIIGVVGSIVVFIVLCADGMFIEGLIALSVGVVASWVSNLIFYGVGEAVEYSKSANYYAKQALNELREIKIENKNTSIQEHETLVSARVEAEEDVAVESAFTIVNNGNIVCEQCKFEQPSGRKVCWKCGAKFKNE